MHMEIPALEVLQYLLPESLLSTTKEYSLRFKSTEI
jgi:hypothetical protein